MRMRTWFNAMYFKPVMCSYDQVSVMSFVTLALGAATNTHSV